MKIIILPSAREDLWEGAEFYDEQEAGVGDYFLECLFSDIDSLESTAGVHRKVFGYHRFLSKVFPHFIYYTVRQDTVFIDAVLDCRRDPLWIKEQLKAE